MIVEKTGTLKNLTIKQYNQDELYKKCGFKKPDDFKKQTEWNVKIEGIKYHVELFGKSEGKANTENKYDFPPPVDSILFFGSCILVAKVKHESSSKLVNLSIELWNKIYEKLFGGFEDLAVTCVEDENEVDELDGVPAEKKTKHGYLKDGFVVDSDDDEEYGSDDDDDSDDLEDSDDVDDSEEQDEELELEDIGSELSEEEYNYSDDGGDDAGVTTVFTNVNTKKKKD